VGDKEVVHVLKAQGFKCHGRAQKPPAGYDMTERQTNKEANRKLS